MLKKWWRTKDVTYHGVRHDALMSKLVSTSTVLLRVLARCSIYDERWSSFCFIVPVIYFDEILNNKVIFFTENASAVCARRSLSAREIEGFPGTRRASGGEARASSSSRRKADRPVPDKAPHRDCGRQKICFRGRQLRDAPFVRAAHVLPAARWAGNIWVAEREKAKARRCRALEGSPRRLSFRARCWMISEPADTRDPSDMQNFVLISSFYLEREQDFHFITALQH